MTHSSEYEEEDLEMYRITSRREVISLLRGIGERNQLVRMLIDHEGDAIVTSILEIDETDNAIYLGGAPTTIMNPRILDSKTLSFETVLESIRILFNSVAATSCTHQGAPALRIPLPATVIRLQRREFYRVPTPMANPVLCTVPVYTDGQEMSIVISLHNISGGGISIVDERKLIDATRGHIYENCRINLPGGPVVVTLQISNLIELTLTNGRSIRKLGCQFVLPSNGVLGTVQKYITKLERNHNAKATGLESSEKLTGKP